MCIHLCVLVRIPQRAKTPPTGIRYPKWCQCSPCEWCCIPASLCRERNVNGSIREITPKSRCLPMNRSRESLPKSQSGLEGAERRACAPKRGRGSPFERRSSAGRHRFRVHARRRSRAAGSKRRPHHRLAPPGLEAMFTLREAPGQIGRDRPAGFKATNATRPLTVERGPSRGAPERATAACRALTLLDVKRGLRLRSRPGGCAGGCFRRLCCGPGASRFSEARPAAGAAFREFPGPE